MPVYYPYTDPCTGITTYSVYPHGQANLGLLNGQTWYDNYIQTPQLQTNNPYNSQGILHDVFLMQAPCDAQFAKATTTADAYPIAANAAISYLQNESLPLDSPSIKKSGAAFVTMMSIIAPLNPNDSNYVNKAMTALENNKLISNDIVVQSITTYLNTLQGITNFDNFVSYQVSFENDVINSSIDTKSKNNILLVLAIGKFSYLFWNQHA